MYGIPYIALPALGPGQTLPSGLIIPNPTITGVVKGVVYDIGQSGVPVHLAPTGSMGNNGALTLGTALPAVYSTGVWIYFPAGAVAAGVPAAPAFLWTIMSSTTAGTVFNSTYSGTGFPAIGTQTAFVTTGPGAFTGVTGAVSTISVTLPAGSLGANGEAEIDFTVGANATAGAKTHTQSFGGTTYDTGNMANNTQFRRRVSMWNRGAANRNGGLATNTSGSTFGLTNSVFVASSVDTGSAVTVLVSLNRATATDVYGVERIRLSARYSD